MVMCVALGACSRGKPQFFGQAADDPLPSPPIYTSESIAPSGAERADSLAAGRVASVFGLNLGPAKGCTATADPKQRETPNPDRPNQTEVELSVFPQQLCGVEVRIGGKRAGLLYVSSKQINFKVPQDVPTHGDSDVRVSYNGLSGPLARVTLAASAATPPAAELADRIWSGLANVRWRSPLERASAQVAQDPSLRRGIYDYAFVRKQEDRGIVAEAFYYPVNQPQPSISLMRADFRLVDPYPELSGEVEQLLIRRLEGRYGKGSVPDNLFEVGARRPEPGLSWKVGEVVVFLNRSRNYVAPGGVRQGVALIAIRREVLELRDLDQRLTHEFQTSARMSPPMFQAELAKELGDTYAAKGDLSRTRSSLILLLREGAASPERRAAALLAADDLAVRLGALLMDRRIASGSEILNERPESAPTRQRLLTLGVKYTGVGHYSGNLEYDRSLLVRAWREYPDTAWGQRAFVMMQTRACELAAVGCHGGDCFRPVIRQGEQFLLDHPSSTFRTQVMFNVARAYETAWSLSKASKVDPTAEGVRVDSAFGDHARLKAIEVYEDLLRLDPSSAEARSGALALPRLRLKLDTGERTFFCTDC